MSWDAVARAVAAEGLGPVGAFHPRRGDGVPDGIGTLVLLGPDDGAMWRAFQAAPEAADGLPDPLDRWSRRVIDSLAARLGAVALYPFGGPPWHPFQRWAVLGEGAVASPVAMQATPSRGLWASWRGALGFSATLALPERRFVDPCLGCNAPCLTACPVGAFSGGGYDVAACVTHLGNDGGAACRAGCLVRQSCPAGASVGLPAGQRAFHMAAFLSAHAPANRGSTQGEGAARPGAVRSSGSA